MPKLRDYETLAPFTADELVQNANTLLRPIPEAQLQKRTLRFYSSQGLLPPPEGPRSKAHYRYEHLVILVALRLFKHLGLKLELIEEVIRNQRAEGIEKLAQTVQNYLDKVQSLSFAEAFDRAEHVTDLLSAELMQLDHLQEIPVMHLAELPPVSHFLRRNLAASLPVKKTTRIQLTPEVTLEFDEAKPLRNALQEAYQRLRELLKQIS
ncbi:MAG: MerR family transcriptional regulator [Armatimonadota bacterium]|nr:MerR family transcriptional regulator [Armatimonadota bacterium]